MRRERNNKKLVFKWGKLTFSFNAITKPFVLKLFKEEKSFSSLPRDDKFLASAKLSAIISFGLNFNQEKTLTKLT